MINKFNSFWWKDAQLSLAMISGRKSENGSPQNEILGGSGSAQENS